LEVTEAWGTAKLRFPKVHVSSKEEVPRPGPHATFQQCRDMALPVAVTLRSWLEDFGLLPMKSAHPQVND
jgi:hypothetical protein